MKKIAFVFDLAYPFTKGGGEKRVYDFAKTLSNFHTVDVLCMKWWKGNDHKELNGVCYISICPKTKLYNKSGKRKLLPSIYFGIKTFVYLLKNNYDIIDFEVFPYFPLIFGKIVLMIKKNKFVIIGHWCEYQGESFWKKYSPIFWWFGRALEHLCYNSSDRIIAISDFTAKKIEKNCGRNKKIEIISPFILDNELIDNIKESAVKDYDLIYFGRLMRHKNIDKIIEVTKRMIEKGIDVRTLIIGNGGHEQELKSMTKDMKLERNVFFLDFINDYSKLIQNIKKAKVFVFPSEREGFGISVVEANACGLPALVIDYPDNAAKELIKNGENGFVCKDDDDFCEKAESLLGGKMLSGMSDKSRVISGQYKKSMVQKKINNFYSIKK